MKKKLLAVAVIAICLSLTAYGTWAYFTAEDIAHNVITSGDIDIELLEWADEEKTIPFPEDGVSGVMPGMEVTKIAEVTNTGGNDAWIRVTVEKSFTLAGSGTADPSLMVIDFDKDNWTEKDGYYYYNVILKPGETTTPLFASVSFDAAGMGNEYQKSTATVDVTAYAVQVANNGETALDAQGWPD